MDKMGKRFFDGLNYVSLETYKKNGQSVRTPVWFVETDDALYIRTQAHTWKVKRIRNHAAVRLAPCTGNGMITGNWIDGSASILSADEGKPVLSMIAKKYGIMARIVDFFLSLSRNYAVLVIEVNLAAKNGAHV